MILNSVVREEMVQSILANDVFGALCIDYMDMMSDGEVVTLYTKAK